MGAFVYLKYSKKTRPGKRISAGVNVDAFS